jgi:SAM-dependent methyltransferase
VTELERLRRDYGWDAPKKDSHGVRRFTSLSINGKEISFPAVAYESESLSRGDFWSKFRVKIISDALNRHDISCLWEIGAGDGRVAIPLSDLGFDVLAVEPIEDGARRIASNGLVTFQALLEDLQLPEGCLEALGVFDVLEHVKDELDFLNEIKRTLKNNGKILITVPAHSWLFSEHDEILGHYRRYSRENLTKVLEMAELRVLEIRYVFSSLVVPAFFLRRLPHKLGFRKGSKERLQASEATLDLPKYLDYILFNIMKFEYIFKFRFGLSLFVVAQKN